MLKKKLKLSIVIIDTFLIVVSAVRSLRVGSSHVVLLPNSNVMPSGLLTIANPTDKSVNAERQEPWRAGAFGVKHHSRGPHLLRELRTAAAPPP